VSERKVLLADLIHADVDDRGRVILTAECDGEILSRVALSDDALEALWKYVRILKVHTLRPKEQRG